MVNGLPRDNPTGREQQVCAAWVHCPVGRYSEALQQPFAYDFGGLYSAPRIYPHSQVE